jgi:hypothetical protein
VRSSRTPSNTPISRRDADGNTYQRRTLDDGSVHEVLKNFPTCEQAFSICDRRALQRGGPSDDEVARAAQRVSP